MTLDCLRLFVLGQGAWMLGVLAVLLTTGHFSLETYFVTSFIGLLAVMQVSAPTGERPGWWRTLRAVEGACFLVLAYVIYGHVSTVL